LAQHGDTVTFHVLFVDSFNDGMVVADATIEVFTFNADGVRTVLAAAGTAMDADAENGHYSYQFEVDGDWTGLGYSPRIHALMQATDPVGGGKILAEDSADIYPKGGTSSTGGGMTAKLVQ
jgi:hypothetical protein